MKIFLGFRFSGEDPAELDKSLGAVRDCLEKLGHECLCTLWDEQMFQEKKFGHREIMEWGLGKLDQCDALLAVVKSTEKSEGMLLEVGYAMAKGKKVILAIKKGTQSRFIQAIANQVVEFENTGDLCQNLRV